MTVPSESDRALGALYGLAVGDALGMPTQLLSPAEVDRRFGSISWFQPAPDDPFLASRRTYWENNGQITRTVLIA